MLALACLLCAVDLTVLHLAVKPSPSAVAVPVGWRFTRTDLDRPLHRIDTHQPGVPALAA